MQKQFKIFTNKANEKWVVDRFRSEWISENKHLNTNNINKADIVWLIAPWKWKNIDIEVLKSKKVVCTIHHIDESKFSNDDIKEFLKRDEIVDVYHVPSESTKKTLIKYTNKEVKALPFWINTNIFFEISSKNEIRKKFSIAEESYVVGSFQRDTEGQDLITPKLSKGPDIFLKNLEILKEKKQNIFVLLGGYRRQFVERGLVDLNISYKYFKKPSIKKINLMYNCLDLYIVSSRVEGGPQAIMESAITKTPIVSTKVGLAEEILHFESIYSDGNFLNSKPNIEIAYNNANKHVIPKSMPEFKKFFLGIYEN